MSLMRALDTQDRQETERILRSTPTEVSVRDADGRVALHYAAETMDTEIFMEIYRQDPSLVDSQDNEGLTPLVMSIMKGRLDLVEFLLEKGANMNQTDKFGHSIVHWAVVCGQLDVLVYLLSKGAQPSIPDHNVATPLHYATAGEDLPHELALSILHTLLRGGAVVDAKDMDERTPILWSASNGNLEAIMSLKQAGGDIMAVDRDQLAVIHCAASHGYHEVIEYFMECVPRQMINIRDRHGASALFYAVTFGHYEVARKLLTFGSLPNLQDNHLRTAAHCGAAKGQMRMLKLLRQYNASFEIQNYRGDLPIHEAVQVDCKDVVEWLLALHPDTINAASHEGRTCLHLAAAKGSIEMVVLLCTKGCFIDPLMLHDDTLYTPLDLAEKRKHQVVVDYLRSRRALHASEVDEETRQNSRITFEERMVAAQLDKVTMGIVSDPNRMNERLQGKIKEIRSTAVNTSARRNSVGVAKVEKTTLTDGSEEEKVAEARRRSSLKSSEELQKTATEHAEEIMRRIIREEVHQEISNKSSLKSIEEQPKVEELPGESSHPQRNSDADNIDDYYEDLPGISDSSEIEPDDEKSVHSDNETPKVAANGKIKKFGSQKENDNKKTKRMISGKAHKREKTTKAVRIASQVDSEDEENVFEGEAEGGEGQSGEANENTRRPSRKKIQEKSIFQELTHLKRMQIQYGKVQEKVLVKSLVANFCKMHGLDPANYKFSTFYAWEKYLYDQLKIIYLDERQRLTHVAFHEPRLDKFETRLRAARAVPLNDKVSRMSKVYGSGTMTSGKTAVKRDKTPGGTEKRCNCLGKHLLIQDK